MTGNEQSQVQYSTSRNLQTGSSTGKSNERQPRNIGGSMQVYTIN